MQFFSADLIYQQTDIRALAERVGAYMSEGTTTPDRFHLDFENPGHDDSTLLLMPSWRTAEYLGVKVVTISPDNGRYELPSIYAQYLLFDAQKGRHLAIFDGKALTNVRTAASSLLAARSLVPQSASTYLIVGTGALAAHYARGYATIFPLNELLIWGRNFAKADKLAEQLVDLPCSVRPVQDRAAAQTKADIISALTLTQSPLLFGHLARPGQHYDLVGAYKPDRREADGELMRSAQLFVDTRFGALHEAGDVMLAIEEGAISADQICCELHDLYKGTHPGRHTEEEITVFKSVGHAAEDLAAAVMLYEQ